MDKIMHTTFWVWLKS